MSRRTVFSRPLSLLLAAALLFAVLLSGSSCGSGFSADVQKRLEEAVDKVLSETGAPGAVAGVWTPEGTWTYAAGKADIKTGKPMQTGLRFRAGSNTKTFVATVVLQLAGEGKLGLGDPLSKYEPWVPNAVNITLGQLLDHTSGLFNYTDSDAFQNAFLQDPEKQWAPKELVQMGVSQPPYFAPGKGWKYSSTNYILLGMIVEKVTGKKLASEIKARICSRLGLKDTYLADGSKIEGEYFHGYWDPQGNGNLEDITRENVSWAWAAGSMVTDLDDMHAYAEATGTGRLLTPAMQKKRMTWVNAGAMPAYLPLEYGLGIAKEGSLIGHNGGIMGYTSAAFYLPDKKATFVVCLSKFPNAQGTSDEMLQGTVRVLYPEVFQKR